MSDLMLESLKAQSAMEYLMTYSWAILIIAVVIAGLFALGVFNSFLVTPRAQPGSCTVYRPSGPGTVFLIDLTGTCLQESPEYVGVFGGAGTVSTGPNTFPTNSLTFSAWVYYSADTGNPEDVIAVDSYSGMPVIVPYVATSTQTFYVTFYWSGGSSTTYNSGLTVTPDEWNFISVTYNEVDINSWVDGNAGTTTAATSALNSNPTSNTLIGGLSSSDYWDGDISNVQLYNASLSTAEMTALYKEGIGGSPILLQNLVAWWPLNGNADDYSGNNNNGATSGVTFTSSWTSGYTHP